jgi:bifunctional DNA-binding transcriptional regulator/antitoxin component of YhaV-PrlF toxin-antitoxin module
MKIQKQVALKKENKTYYKYVITIPEENIVKANLKEGDELEIESRKESIFLKKKKLNK